MHSNTKQGISKATGEKSSFLAHRETQPSSRQQRSRTYFAIHTAYQQRLHCVESASEAAS